MSNNKEIDFMMDLVEHNGAACSTVNDGHVLIFKMDFLKDLVEKNKEQDKIVIFVKRQDFKN